LALIALTYRVTVDSLARTDPQKNARWSEILDQLRSWVRSQGIEQHLSGTERDALAQQLGQIEEDILFDLSWRLQALIAVLWALNKIESMPTYAESHSADALQPLLPFGRPIGRRACDAASPRRVLELASADRPAAPARHEATGGRDL
jgi:hypothetical protein